MLSFRSSVKQLIEKHELKRVLIAFSGGPDSQSLLLTLLDFKDQLEIGVAHVDHGWREESSTEAAALKEQIEALGLPFYFKKLAGAVAASRIPDEIMKGAKKLKAVPGGNLEEICREERYAFFAEVCQSQNYQGVFLGHHRDDWAETVLKRVLEGASLTHLGGMKPSSYYKGLLILRPFLEWPKEALLNYLGAIPYIKDRTNEDPRFLRGKMRTTILPELCRQFGKSVQNPLIQLAKESHDLDFFMRNRFQQELESRERLDLKHVETLFELRWLIRAWLKNHDLNPSRAVLDNAAQLILKRAANRVFIIKNQKVYVDRGRLYFTSLP